MIQVRCETLCRSPLQMGDQTRSRVELLPTSETDGPDHSLIRSIDAAMQDPGMYSQGRARCESCPTLITYQLRQSQHRTTQPIWDRNRRPHAIIVTHVLRTSFVWHTSTMFYKDQAILTTTLQPSRKPENPWKGPAEALIPTAL